MYSVGEEDEEQFADPRMFIKDLDTGMKVRLDEFERLTHVSEDEPTVQQVSTKKSPFVKSTKKIKNWVQQRAKIAFADLKVKHVSEKTRRDVHPEPTVPEELDNARQTLVPAANFQVSRLSVDTESTVSEPVSSLSLELPHPHSSCPAPAKDITTVRLTSNKRARREVAEVQLCQTLTGHDGAIWTARFTPDGSYLVTAGQDHVVRVWQVAGLRDVIEDGTSESSQCSSGGTDPIMQESCTSGDVDACSRSGPQDNNGPLNPPGDPGPCFWTVPCREYQGHTDDVLDVSCSASGFILSASVDKTVRLWHIRERGCLRVFKHSDFVTCVQFSPVDANRFVTGSIDGKVRLWGVLEGTVLASVNVHQDMVTALCVSNDGTRVVVGTIHGKCRVYEMGENKMEYVTQIDVRNQRGQHASGKKITSIAAVPSQNEKFVVASNDSRIRMYNGYAVQFKFKGLRNAMTQIRAAVTDAGDKVISGSDDGRVFMWNCTARPRNSMDDDECADMGGKVFNFEAFQAQDGPVTVALFAPDNLIPGCRDLKSSRTVSSDLPSVGPRRPTAVGSTSQGSSQVMVTAGFGGAIKVFLIVYNTSRNGDKVS